MRRFNNGICATNINALHIGNFLRERICHWLLIFQEFYFDVVVKKNNNVGPYHLSRVDFGEFEGSIDDQLSDVQLFQVDVVLFQFTEIATFIMIGK